MVYKGRVRQKKEVKQDFPRPLVKGILGIIATQVHDVILKIISSAFFDAPTNGDESVSGEMVQAEAQSFPLRPTQVRQTHAQGFPAALEGIAEERPCQTIGLTGGLSSSLSSRNLSKDCKRSTQEPNIMSLTGSPGFPNYQEHTALSVSKRLVIGHQVSFNTKGTKIIFDIPVFL